MNEGLPTKRLALLAQQLYAAAEASAAKSGRNATWTSVAKKLGVGDTLLNKIKSGSRSRISSDTIQHAIDHFNIDPAFFFDPTLDEPDHRDFIRTRVSRRPDPPPFWADFEANWPRQAELTSQEREALWSLVDDEHAVEMWTDWIPLAEWLLRRRR